jgi:hypothetical protein
VGVLLHSVHIALLVLGGAGVAVLLRPDQPRPARAIRRLRAAATNGTLVDLAYERARVALDPRPPAARPPAARVLYAVSFAGINVAVGVLANRLSGGVIPPWWSVAILGAVLVAAGLWLFGGARPGRAVAGVAAVAQVVVHAGLVLAVIYQAHRAGLKPSASLTELLFCHRAGFVPTGSQLAAAARGLDLGPAAPPTGLVSLSASLVLATSLAVATVAAWWLNLRSADERR